jgi:NADH-quinone oxidoreductase subunit N
MMHFDLQVPSQLSLALLPELVLMGGAMVLMLLAAWGSESESRQRTVGAGSIGVLLVTLGLVIWYETAGATSNAGIIAVDSFRWTADVILLVAAIATIALSIEYNAREGIHYAESHVLVLFATSGMMMLTAARDLMIVFLGIEIMSIAVYVLVGMNRRSERSAEASLKYFLLGAFATGFLLYGIALIYGATGATNLMVIGQRIHDFSLTHNAMLMIGVALLLIGFGFKVAVVPFHMWAPDVYEGAPTPITAFMASAVKAAAFAAFFRVWIEALGQMAFAWAGAIWLLAAATMIFGNAVGLAQRNIKRLLAYSSVVHSGYLLVGVLAGTMLGASAFLFYLFAYTLATFGSFAVICAVSEPGEKKLGINDFQGLWTVRPGLSVAMAVCMLALLGFPVFGGVGFFGKWYLLQAAIGSPLQLIPLAVLLVLTSVISAGYYLNVVRVMFMVPRQEGATDPALTGLITRLVLIASVVVMLVLGLFPGPLTNWTQRSRPTPPPATAADSARMLRPGPARLPLPGSRA